MSEHPFVDSQASLIHGPFQPASVFPGMGVKACMPVGDTQLDLRVWRLSPHGVEVIWTTEQHCEPGQSIFLYLHLGAAVIGCEGVVVLSQTGDDGQKLVGIIFETPARAERPRNAQREARLHARWNVDKRFYPSGAAQSPINFHDAILFTVADVSASGMRLLTSMRNKFLLPGLTLQAKISFPPFGSIDVSLLLKNAYVVDDNGEIMQSFGAHVLNKTQEFTKTVGDYVLRFAKSEQAISPALLAASQLQAAPTLEMVDWGFAERASDQTEVQELINQGHAELDTKISVLHAWPDTPRKLLIGRLQGRIIASLSLGFLPGVDSASSSSPLLRTKHRTYKADESVQLTNIVLRQDFQTQQLLDGLLLFSFFIVLQSGRQVVFCDAEPVGFFNTGHLGLKHGVLESTELGGDRHVAPIAIAHLPSLLSGKGLSVANWHRMFHASSGHFSHNAWQRFTETKSLRHRLYELSTKWFKVRSDRDL